MTTVLTAPVAAVDTFEQLILQQRADELLPFLLALPKADVVPVRKATLRLYRELNRFEQQADGSWGSRSTQEQNGMLFLTGVRTYSRREALGSTFRSWWPIVRNQADFLTIVAHTQPDWLPDWLRSWSAENRWSTTPYSLLRELEARQLLDFDPQLFAPAVAGRLHELAEPFQQPPLPTSVAGLLLAELRTDTVLLERDLPLLFDFDTSVDTAQAYVQEPRPNWYQGLDWRVWHEQHPSQVVKWLDVLPALVASGHLSRAEMLTRCLLAMRRDFRRPLLTWFRMLYLALQPSPDEQLARQAELVELLAHPLPLVVNFALDQLRLLWREPGFAVAPLLQYAEGLMTRADLKTGLRSLLTGLDKLLRQVPALAQQVAPLAVAGLPNTDAAVQERAARLLAGLLGSRKPLLTAESAAATVAAIEPYADLLSAPARAVLAPYLPAPETAATATYEPAADFCPELSAATAIEPVQDWHELLFLTGQVLQHNDPGALERWLDGLLRLRPHFPADYAAALQPYLQQILPYWPNATEAERAALLRRPPVHGHFGLIRALVVSWAGGFGLPLVEQVKLRDTYLVTDPLAELQRLRLLAVEARLRDAVPLPLLSTPTHAPAWVAPGALVQRLLAHEAAGLTPDAADLTLALARTAPAQAADDAASLQEPLSQVQHTGLRELLTRFLAPELQPLPAAATLRRSPLKQLTARLGQLIPRLTRPATLDEALPWLWAVAARTRQSTVPVPELATLSNYPGVAGPWQPRWGVVPKSRTYVESWKPGKPEVTEQWLELAFAAEPAARVVPSPLLVYAQHVSFPEMAKTNWTLAAEFPFLAAMLPQHPAPLHWHLVRSLDIRTGSADASTRDLVTQGLLSLFAPGPRYDEAATLLLTVGLLHAAGECRALALEVLLAAVDSGRLDPAPLGRMLGQLLNLEMMPVQRLADGLTQVRSINPRTDDALRQVLNELLPALPAAPPRNTRKLLETYADLLARTRQMAPAPVLDRLQAWVSIATLKKTIGSLLV